jgi:branched-chain amino acid aminotransferase
MPSFLAYQSGQYKPLEEISIALNDAGFVYGATVTDQCRTYRQKPFRLTEHLQRFRRSCELCKVTHRCSDEELRGIIEKLLIENSKHVSPQTEWVVVWLATPGKIGSFLGQPGAIEKAEPQLTTYCYPLDFARFRSYFEKGAEVRVPSSWSIPEYHEQREAKHRNRLLWWLTEYEVRSLYPQAQALATEFGTVTETSSANFLLVCDGQVLSPRSKQVLPGISLRVAEELCQQLGVLFFEMYIDIDTLAHADEALLCSTPYGIAPIGNLNGRQLPVNGPVFERLLAAWNELVGLDIRQQFLSANS